MHHPRYISIGRKELPVTISPAVLLLLRLLTRVDPGTRFPRPLRGWRVSPGRRPAPHVGLRLRILRTRNPHQPQDLSNSTNRWMHRLVSPANSLSYFSLPDILSQTRF